MSFKFNFSDNNDELNKKDVEDMPKLKWLPSEEVKLTTQLENLGVMAKQARMYTCDDIEIGHVIPGEAVLSMIHNKESILNNAEKLHSDLITAEYEGGLKVWECTNDLIEYLDTNKSELNLNQKNVLDLGCGAGLIGIYAFLNGATVTFQDYNKEVLECVTIPNVLLNIEEEDKIEDELSRCKFYSGDWQSFDSLLDKSESYDFIFTSETIYNTDNYEKLIKLFENRLKEDGQIYVAAKTYYFGVGGGTRQFENTLSDKSKSLKNSVVWKSAGGIQREIIKLSKC